MLIPHLNNRTWVCLVNAQKSYHNCYQSFKKNASAGSRTRIYCLEGNYPNRWTTDACWKSTRSELILSEYIQIRINIIRIHTKFTVLNSTHSVVCRCWCWRQQAGGSWLKVLYLVTWHVVSMAKPTINYVFVKMYSRPFISFIYRIDLNNLNFTLRYLPQIDGSQLKYRMTWWNWQSTKWILTSNHTNC